MNNDLYIQVSSTPPLVRGKPVEELKARSWKLKVGSTKLERQIMQLLVQNNFSPFGGNVQRTKGATCNFQSVTFNLTSRGRHLLNFRDGPEESDQSPSQFSTVIAIQGGQSGVLISALASLRENNPFAKSWLPSGILCVFSVSSILKFKPQRTRRSHGESQRGKFAVISHSDQKKFQFTISYPEDFGGEIRN